MAFSIMYSGDKENSPYTDWARFDNPISAAFKYTEHDMDDIFTLIYDPSMMTLFIDMRFEYWDMTAIVEVHVYDDVKKLSCVSVYCKANDHWPDMNGHAPHGSGGMDLFNKALQFADGINPLFTAATKFFGKEWSWIPLPETSYETDDGHEETMSYMLDWEDFLHCPFGPWGKTTAYMNFDIEELAATKIQAAFRGWKVRMDYRYNPYTSLGRYVLLHEAGFA